MKVGELKDWLNQVENDLDVIVVGKNGSYVDSFCSLETFCNSQDDQDCINVVVINEDDLDET